eukprot:SAG31_NODE_1966_length_6786_cov_7.109167_1_plen_216_part_00
MSRRRLGLQAAPGVWSEKDAITAVTKLPLMSTTTTVCDQDTSRSAIVAKLSAKRTQAAATLDQATARFLHERQQEKQLPLVQQDEQNRCSGGSNELPSLFAGLWEQVSAISSQQWLQEEREWELEEARRLLREIDEEVWTQLGQTALPADPPEMLVASACHTMLTAAPLGFATTSNSLWQAGPPPLLVDDEGDSVLGRYFDLQCEQFSSRRSHLS